MFWKHADILQVIYQRCYYLYMVFMWTVLYLTRQEFWHSIAKSNPTRQYWFSEWESLRLWQRFTFYLSAQTTLNKYSTIKIVKNIHTDGWDFQNGSELRAMVPAKEHLINEHSRINLYLLDKNWVLKWQVCLLES